MKIIIEIILGFVSLIMSYAFWNCVKSPKFFIRVANDFEELKKIYDHFGADQIRSESEKVRPMIGDSSMGYSGNIAIWLQASLKALDKTRNMLLVITALLFVGSFYFLGGVFLTIEIILFIMMAFPEISPSAKNNMVSDIQTIMLNVHKWNRVNPEECKQFCANERRLYLSNIYRVVVEKDKD